MLWHGRPILNPEIVGRRVVRPGFVTFFDEITPGFLPGADHDAWFLTTFRKALTTSEPTEYEDLEPWVCVQFFPNGINLPLRSPVEREKPWPYFDLLVLLTPYQLHPDGVDAGGMGLGGAPAFYMGPERAAAAAFFFDLLDEYLALLSPEDRREGAAELAPLLDGIDLSRRVFLPGSTTGA
jgi:hypothetical protein